MDTHIEIDSGVDPQQVIDQYLAERSPEERRRFIGEHLTDDKSSDRRNLYDAYGTGLYWAVLAWAGLLYVIALLGMIAGMVVVSLWYAVTKPAYRRIWWRAMVLRIQAIGSWRRKVIHEAGIRHA